VSRIYAPVPPGLAPTLRGVESAGAHSSGPVFVGGTGRCGTHAVAALLASGPEYALVPAELRLHTDLLGLPAFVRGDCGRARISRELLTRWWRRPAPWDPGAPRGTHRIAPRSRNARAVAALLAAPPGTDRARLAAAYVNSLLDPLAPQPGAWVEKTPDNCAAAGFLRELFGGMRVVHVIRDGRDVACSLMRVPWAPDSFEPALEAWERGMLRAHRGSLEAAPSSVHRLLLEDLVARDRERAYDGLLAFLGLPDSPRRRRFFERELTPGRARIGRWRRDLPRSERDRADCLYRDALARLAAAGVGPLPVADYEEPPEPLARAPSSIDPWALTTA
jgi:Sulfotransferase family